MDTRSIIETAKLLVGEWAETINQPTPNWLDIFLFRPEDLVPAVAGLRVKRLGYLTAITGIDLGGRENQIEVIYHFCVDKAVINLRLHLPRDAAFVPSLRQIIPSAEPFERELCEMFGVSTNVFQEVSHLYLPDDWPHDTYPLRKDFNPQILNNQ